MRYPRLTRVMFIITVAALFVYPLANLILQFTQLMDGARLNDFAAYYLAAERFIHGLPLYSISNSGPVPGITGTEAGEYVYLPLYVLIVVPLTYLPFYAAALVWEVAQLAFLLYSVKHLISAYDLRLSRLQWVGVSYAVIGFAPTVQWIKHGQIAGFLAGSLCLAAAYQRGEVNKQNTILTGVYTVIPAFAKPFYATAGAHLLLDRRRLIAAIGTSAALVLSSVFIFGLSTHYDYLGILVQGHGWGERIIPPSTWNAGQFFPLYIFGLGWLKLAVRMLIAVCVAILSILVRDSSARDVPSLVFALGVATIPIVSPIPDAMVLNSLIPVFIILLILEYSREEGLLVVPLVGILLVHAHPYTIEFVAKFGPRYLPFVESLVPALPLLQPALWAEIVLVLYITARILHRSDRFEFVPVVA